MVQLAVEPALAAGLAWCYLGGVVLFLVLLLLWGFADENLHRYLSQMNDRGIEGSLLLFLLLCLLGMSSLSAIWHGHGAAAVLRAALGALVGVLMLTLSYSTLHLRLFPVSIVLAVGCVLSVAVSLARLRRPFAAAALCLVLGLLVGWDQRFGPTWQKLLVAFCLLAEAVQILYCHPRLPPLGAGLPGRLLRGLLALYARPGPVAFGLRPVRPIAIPCSATGHCQPRACHRARTSWRAGSWPTARGRSRGAITGW